MKILSISPKIPFPTIDGHTKSIFGLLKYLSLRGHQIDFVAYDQGKNDEHSIEEIRKYATPFILPVETKNNLFGAVRNIFSDVPYNISKYQRKELSNFLKKYFASNEVDIVHVTNAHMGWVVEIIRKLSNAKVVLRQENLEMMIMKRYSENQSNWLLKFYSGIQYRKFLRYEPALCAKYDACVMMSNMDLEQLKKFRPAVYAQVIPAGIDKDYLDYKSEQVEPFSLYHIGSLEWYPNYDGVNWFIENVLPKLVKEESQIKFYLYGSGISERLTIPSFLKTNVVVKGFADNIWEEIKDKSLAVVPLRIGSGIRIKILELLAFGKIVLTTSLGKEGIPVIDGEHILVADSSDQFVEKILNHFKNYYDNEKISMKAKDLVRKNYTWDIIAEQFENLYENLLNKK